MLTSWGAQTRFGHWNVFWGACMLVQGKQMVAMGPHGAWAVFLGLSAPTRPLGADPDSYLGVDSWGVAS